MFRTATPCGPLPPPAYSPMPAAWGRLGAAAFISLIAKRWGSTSEGREGAARECGKHRRDFALRDTQSDFAEMLFDEPLPQWSRMQRMGTCLSTVQKKLPSMPFLIMTVEPAWGSIARA